jgi:hypothetical protein
VAHARSGVTYPKLVITIGNLELMSHTHTTADESPSMKSQRLVLLFAIPHFYNISPLHVHTGKKVL